MPPSTTTLSTRLREETKAAHTRAERSGIMRALLTGTLPIERYIALQANLYHVYVALEQALRAHAEDPAVAPIHDPRLERIWPLARDLDILAGPGWKVELAPVDAAHRYADRISDAAREDPALLVAHSYTRYLGDLSGGQILHGFAARLLPADQQGAMAFYEFPGIADPQAYKQRYRGALDALDVDEERADRIVAEALLAFDLNTELFEALG